MLGAYQFLLDWHRDWYVADGAEKHARGRAPELYRDPSGGWRLTTAEKKRILLNNIYGVDIDPQAVEVTKLSLLLKILEGESAETLANQLRLYHERALPDLGGNIKCGNSLIGPDYYDDRGKDLPDDEERRRINAFDWNAEFPAAFKAGGFDAVIGNPPWLMAGYYINDGMDYLRCHYTCAQGKFDLYYLFIELGIRRLNPAGCFGMIIPNKFFHTRAARRLRGELSTKRLVHALVDFGYEKLFAGATNYSCIMLLQRAGSRKLRFSRARVGLSVGESFNVPWSHVSDDPWHFANPKIQRLFSRIEKLGCHLSDLVQHFGAGAQTGADRILSLDRDDAEELQIEKNVLRPIFRGRDVRRYRAARNPKVVLFPYKNRGDQFEIYDERTLRSRFPNAHAYLHAHKAALSDRVWFGKNATELSGQWFGMMYLDSRQSFLRPHLLTPSLSDRSNFMLGDGTLFTTGTAGVTSVAPAGSDHHVLYILGLLNSSLLSFYVTHHSPVFQGAYYKFSAPYLKKLPIRTIDFSNHSDKSRHDRMIKLVEAMLKLHQEAAATRTEHEKNLLRRQIEATDRQIDRLVYELYGLTEEEIAIVEETACTTGQTPTSMPGCRPRDRPDAARSNAAPRAAVRRSGRAGGRTAPAASPGSAAPTAGRRPGNRPAAVAGGKRQSSPPAGWWAAGPCG